MNVNLERERLNRGLSRRDAAGQMEVPEATLRRAESGEGIHPRNALKIAQFYGYQVTDVWPLNTTAAA